MRRAGLALLLAAMAVIAPRAWSAPLNLSKDFPDFVVSGLSYGYTAGTGQLIVSGGVSSYTEQLGGSLQNVAVTGGVFNLTATLDSVGNVLSGSFTLTGVVRAPFPVPLYDGAAHSTGNLLQGDLTAFGWAGDSAPSTGGLIEFAFNHADGYIPDPSFPLQELGARPGAGAA
ncbi:MAG: hypothetical protein ACE5G3_10195 [Gammaproteobacteria bacterium]